MAAVVRGPWRRRIARLAPGAAILVIVALAFAVRVVPARAIVLGGPANDAGGVRLFDTDSYYHLRHARFAAAHFPKVQRWDPGLYPDGQPALYAGLFDVAIAGAALIVGGGHPDDATVARAAAWTPPVLGALAFLALFWLARLVSGRGAGVLAAVLLLLYPGTFIHRSLLGAADHHVAEVLLGLLTLWGFAGTLRPPAGENRAPWWRPDWPAALPLAIFFFTWYGAPIYLILVSVTALGVVTVDLASGGASADAVGRAAGRYGLGLLAILLAVWLVAPWLIMDLPTFRKALLAVVLLAGGLPAYAKGLGALIPRARRRFGARAVWVAPAVAFGGVALGAGILLIVVRMVPRAADLAGELIGVKTALVKEQASISPGMFAFLGGAPAFVAFAALPLALRDAWRRPEQYARLAAVVFATLFVGLWLRTHDYGYAAPPFLAFLAADVLARGWRWLGSTRARVASGIVVGAALVLPLWPARAVAPPMPEAATARGFMVLRSGWEQALDWMRTETPPLVLPLDAPVPAAAPGGDGRFHHPPGNYGVQAFWDFGHYVAAIGRRPPLASGGISTSTARWFLLGDEDEAVRALGGGAAGPPPVRYCIVDAQTAGDFLVASIQMAGGAVSDYVQIFNPGSLPSTRLMRFGERYRRSMVARLYEEDGDGLAHFRLVYASPEQSYLAYRAPRDGGPIVRVASVIADADQARALKDVVAVGTPVVGAHEIVYEGLLTSSVKIFEQVRGAHLRGASAPGSIVEARLGLTARAGGESIAYHRAVTVDAAGRFDLVVPYPTEPENAGTDVVAAGAYDLRDAADRSIGRARVGVEDVRDGRPVEISAGPGAPN